MFGNNDNKYATKGELNEVKEALEQNNECLNEVKDNLNSLNTRIETSLGNFKWLLGFIGTIIPIITTVLSMIFNNGQVNLPQIDINENSKPQIIIIDEEYLKQQKQLQNRLKIE